MTKFQNFMTKFQNFMTKFQYFMTHKIYFMTQKIYFMTKFENFMIKSAYKVNIITRNVYIREIKESTKYPNVLSKPKGSLVHTYLKESER